jgi:hypothetical protein
MKNFIYTTVDINYAPDLNNYLTLNTKPIVQDIQDKVRITKIKLLTTHEIAFYFKPNNGKQLYFVIGKIHHTLTYHKIQELLVTLSARYINTTVNLHNLKTVTY